MHSQATPLYHFVGIKGAGMSALALILHEKGYRVQGSDSEKYYFTQRELEKEQVPIYPFAENNIKAEMIIIAGNAFPDSHPEIQAALKKGLQVIRYHRFLGDFIKSFTSIAVTGSHGKTSTTGLLAHVLSGIEPTSYLIGDGTGHGVPGAKYFSFEACEYRRHFLAYSPDYAIITNIDFDHPDYFKSLADVFDAFQSFASQVSKGIIAFGDDEHLRQLQASCPIYYYGIKEEDDFQAKNIKRTTSGSSFEVFYHQQSIGLYSVPSYGMHNVYNALSVIAVTYLEGLDSDLVAAEMQTFGGVKRRFSEKKVDDMIIVDDYAHHPAEIIATIDAARQKYPQKEVIAVFQPHTFTRTVALLDDFAKALDLADHVYLCEIFGSARERQGDVRIEDLGDKIAKGGDVLHEEKMSPLLDYRNAVMIFMGAGDVQKFQHSYENLLGTTRRNKM